MTTERKEDDHQPKQAVRLEIGQRLKEERQRLGVKVADFGRYGDWPVRTVHGWETGRTTPKAEFFADVQELGLDVGYIITGRRSRSGPAPAPLNDEDAIYVPRLQGKGSMGGGAALAEEVILAEVPFSRRWLTTHVPRSRPEGLRLLHSLGDSMKGTLNSGDFALVDTDYRTADIDGVYVLEVHEHLYIKRVTRRLDGVQEVTSDNPSVRTVDVLDGSHQVRICGRVVYGWNGRRF